jgi:hypothetical protein
MPRPWVARDSSCPHRRTELARLMVDHNCGVRVEETFILKQVDEDFFDET